MQYTDIRRRLNSGDLLAWSHRGWRSWYDIQIQIVRMFTRSEYCHVGVVWRIGERMMVLEAVQAGVRIFPLSRLLPFYLLRVPAQWTEQAERLALAEVGNPYSKWQAVLAGLGLLRAGTDTAWQCAEYAQYVLHGAGVRLDCEPTPTAVVQAAMALPGVVARYVQ